MRIAVGSEEAIVVPQTAVLQGNQGRYVWTVGADGKAAQRTVEAGAWSGQDWVIRKGLNSGDTVIVDNLMKLKAGSAVTARAGRLEGLSGIVGGSMLARYFIDRPVLAGVAAIIVVIAGLVAAAILPVAQFPDIAPPTVVIGTNYPGASAETITRAVAGPIEERLSGIEDLLYFNSSAVVER